MSLFTVRINELPQHVDELALADKVPLWISNTNNTKHISLDALRSFLITGGASTITPVLSGGVILYKVPDTPAGTDTVSIPSLAGKSFNLEINGIPYIPQQNPTIPDAEYEILAGGGFKLINGVELFGGEKCKLEIFGSVLPPVGTPGLGAALIEGVVEVNSNYTLDVANDLRKLVQLRGTSTAITLTIPDVNDIDDHTIIVIEASINNTKQNRVTTTGGQYIYFNNTSKTSIYLHPGEVVWLYRGDDGLYVINDFGNNYKTLGDPYASYTVKPNTLLCNGQEVLRADWPRLWEFVQTLGASLVSDATWSTTEVYHKDGSFYTSAPAAPYDTVPLPYRGCFSTGNGTTTFRVPNLMNMFLRGLKSEFGSDTERYQSKPGMFQLNENKAHKHTGKMGEGTGPDSVPDNVTPNALNNGNRTYETDEAGGVEARPDNIGVYWLINV